MRKGLGANQDFPKSFDVVTKAQIILSSHVQNSIFKHYEQLQQDLKEDKITEASAMEINHELRERPSKPEEFNEDTVGPSLSFLESESLFEEIAHDKERKEKSLRDAQNRIAEFERKDAERQAGEDARRLAEAEENHKLQEFNYCKAAWKKEVRTQFGYVARFAGVVVLTTTVITAGLLLKVFKSFTIPFDQWTPALYGFWVLIIGLCVVELVGRSYIFNKDKLKAGWIWITFLFRRSNFHEFKESKLRSYAAEFNSSGE